MFLARSLLLTVATVSTAAFAQSSAPTFEVASIKPCKEGEIRPGRNAGGGQGKSSNGDSSRGPSLGYLDLNCYPLRILISFAYVNFVNGQVNTARELGVDIEGGPEWVRSDSDTYAITARAAGPASQAMMRGPMLRALLEERFHLQIRRETREGPVFELTVAKGGVKMRRTPEGSCVPRDLNLYPQPPNAPDGKPWCATINYRSSRQTMTGIIDVIGATTAEMAPYLSTGGRKVIDKTGLEGRFDFHLEYAREGGPPPADADPAHAGPTIFAAVQETLGLKLTPAKGPVTVLVIEHVERPEGN
jgi:uncharacterized protein (TIGR03435 family)